MKEYSLAQVIDKFERNHSLKFEYLGDEDHGVEKGTVVHLSENGYVVNDFGGSVLSQFNLGSKFRLVNEPVSFTEAVKAYLEEKIIYCEFENEKCRYIPLEDDISHPLWDKNQNHITAEEILYGKWFIEGDD